MPKRSLSADDLGMLLFFLALLLGIWFRLYMPLNAGFPIGDGGLFAAMIQTLRENHFRLPEFVQYNGLNIPYAYPPLGFYVAGWFTGVFHTTVLNTLRWLPAVVLCLTLPAVYLLGLLLLKSHFKAGLTAVFYALLPGSMTWLIMGGGITRSFGQLFLILTTACVYLLFTSGQKKHIPASIICSTLVCLSHPEATIHTLAFAAILWLFYGRTRAGIFHALQVAFGTLLLTSPWWLTILFRFGIGPYLSASQTGSSQAVILLAPFVSFSQETFLPVLSLLAILGIVYSIAQKEYLLPVLYLVPFLVEARNATNVYLVPLALLASLAVSDMLLPALARAQAAVTNKVFTMPLQSFPEQMLLLYLMVSLIFGMQVASVQYSNRRISLDSLNAFTWIQAHTPPESSFLVLTGVTGQLNDFTNEWFPILARRRSVTTIQGLEWLGNKQFTEKRAAIADIQTCRSVPRIAECLEQNPSRGKLAWDYIVITTTVSTSPTNSNLALTNILISPEYQIIYSSADTLILQKVIAN